MKGRTAFLMIFLAAGLAGADDASFLGDGATVYANHENRIRMAAETVKIHYEKKESDWPWKADCTFEFENLSDQDITLQMGFPDWKGFGDAAGRGFVIKNFLTDVDGKEVPTSHKEYGSATSSVSDKDSWPWNREGKAPTFHGAIVWPVTFKAKEKHTVHNSFTFGGFNSNGPFSVLFEMPSSYPKVHKQDLFWQGAKSKKKEADFANSTVGAVTYIMTTANTWSGSIGKADISIELPEFLQKAPHYVIPYPSGYHQSAKEISWHFENYTPKSEVTIYYLTHVFYEDTNDVVGLQSREQALSWLKFVKKSHVDTDVIETVAKLSSSKAKAVLHE